MQLGETMRNIGGAIVSSLAISYLVYAYEAMLQALKTHYPVNNVSVIVIMKKRSSITFPPYQIVFRVLLNHGKPHELY